MERVSIQTIASENLEVRTNNTEVFETKDAESYIESKIKDDLRYLADNIQFYTSVMMNVFGKKRVVQYQYKELQGCVVCVQKIYEKV